MFDSVNWGAIRTVRARLPPMQQMQTSKIMHDWLPVMHMQAHITNNSQYPGCLCSDETLTHLFQCPNRNLTLIRDSLLVGLRTKGMKLGVPRVIMETITALLSTLIPAGCSYSSRTPRPSIGSAVSVRDRSTYVTAGIPQHTMG